MKRPLTSLLAASLFAAACGSSSAPAGPTPLTATIEGVVFSFAEDFLVSFKSPAATAQVTAIGIWTNGTVRDVTSTCTNWQSDDTRVLSVNSAGLMTAHSSSGTATVTASCESVSASGLVAVNAPTTTSVPNAPGPAPGPPFTSCPTPPYRWDSNPAVLRCRAPNGQFAPSACCGR
jgi:hypothetical protein